MNIIIFISLIALVFTFVGELIGAFKKIKEIPIEKVKEGKKLFFTFFRLLYNPYFWLMVLIASIFASFF